MKRTRDKSMIPYILLVAVFLVAFAIFVSFAVRSSLMKKHFWFECAYFTNADTLYSEYEGQKYRILPDNVSSFGSLLMNDLFAVDNKISVTGDKLILYAPVKDFVYCMTMEKTEDARVTRITLQGEKYTYVYDYEGLNYFDKFVKAMAEQGYQGENNKIEAFPFKQ